MTERKLVPKIRFKRFEEEWLKTDFGKIVFRNSATTDSKELRSVEYENINSEYGTVTKSYNNKKGIKFKKGDVLFGKLRPYLKNWILTCFEGKAVGDFWVLSSRKGFDSSFVFYLIQTNRFAFISNITTGTKMPRSDWNLVSNTSFDIPIKSEQQKIGDLFAKFDRLLDLQQQKLDQLKLLKKALLQKLFSKQGTITPDLRFKGFEEEWKQEQFSDLYKKRSEKNDLTFGPDRIISVANMYFKQTETRSDEKYMKTYNVFRLGDIAFEGNKSKRFSFGRFVENTVGDGIVSHVFEVFRPITSYDLNYWKYAIHNENFMGPILRRSTIKATMMNNLIEKDFLKQKVSVPKLSEQQKIGNLIAKVDRLIELENKKFSSLKQIKKSLLQNMFVE